MKKSYLVSIASSLLVRSFILTFLRHRPMQKSLFRAPNLSSTRTQPWTPQMNLKHRSPDRRYQIMM